MDSNRKRLLDLVMAIVFSAAAIGGGIRVHTGDWPVVMPVALGIAAVVSWIQLFLNHQRDGTSRGGSGRTNRTSEKE